MSTFLPHDISSIGNSDKTGNTQSVTPAHPVDSNRFLVFHAPSGPAYLLLVSRAFKFVAATFFESLFGPVINHNPERDNILLFF